MIYFLRHSIDDSSRRGGWSKAKLTKEGKILAEQTANKLINYRFNKIVCSDLVRAKQTGRIINKKLKLPITYTKALREFNAGVISGMKYEKAEKLFPVKDLDYKNMNFKFPKGETLGDFKNRVIDYYNNYIKINNNVLFITHRNVISVLYNYINQTEWNFNDKKAILIEHCSLFTVKNNSINKI